MKVPKGLRIGLWLLLLAGAVTFGGAIQTAQPLRAWQIFLVNVLFWSGLALGGVAFAATYDLTRARWGPTCQRVAQGMGVFLPLSLGLFLILFTGSTALLPWVHEPLPEKANWLNLPFLISRDTLGLLILYGFALAYLYHALRPTLGADPQQPPQTVIHRLLTRGWRGTEAEHDHSRRILSFVVPLFLILYAVVLSLIGFDWVMSLDPHWYSTLFGAYFFISGFYVALAATAIFTVMLRVSGALPDGRSPLHDLGKLLFGFCLVAGDFFWSQYVVIWYGNIPEETEYVILRTREMPWAVLAWLVLILCYIGPFIVLLSRRVKENPVTLTALAIGIVIGMWVERYLLVVPSLWPTSSLPLGWQEVLITGGFFALFLLTYLAAMKRVPLVPRSLDAPDDAVATR